MDDVYVLAIHPIQFPVQFPVTLYLYIIQCTLFPLENALLLPFLWRYCNPELVCSMFLFKSHHVFNERSHCLENKHVYFNLLTWYYFQCYNEVYETSHNKELSQDALLCYMLAKENGRDKPSAPRYLIIKCYYCKNKSLKNQ